MPIFEYRCTQCLNEFECLVMSSGQTITCPACAGSEVRKLFSLFAVKGGSERTQGGSSCGSCSGTHCSSCH